jgi:DNA gyrase subunit B
MLLASALDDAELHVNSGAPALSGQGLQGLARQYMEVQAIIKRWARRYDERLLDQLIYMPAVSAAEFERADWMRDWTRDLAQHLNGLSDSPRSYRVGAPPG